MLLAFGLIVTVGSTSPLNILPHVQYTVHLVPVSAALAPLGVDRLFPCTESGAAPKARRTLVVLLLLCSLAASLRWGSLLPLLRQPLAPAVRAPEYEAAARLLARVPDDESLAADRVMLTFTASRPNLRRIEEYQAAEWVIAGAPGRGGRDDAAAAVEGLWDAQVARDPRFSRIREDDGLVLYQRSGQPDR